MEVDWTKAPLKDLKGWFVELKLQAELAAGTSKILASQIPDVHGEEVAEATTQDEDLGQAVLDAMSAVGELHKALLQFSRALNDRMAQVFNLPDPPPEPIRPHTLN